MPHTPSFAGIQRLVPSAIARKAVPLLVLTALGAPGLSAQGTCGSCFGPGSCPPTYPMGEGPGEDHSCESWSDALLLAADLSLANLSRAVLSEVYLVEADLSGADLTDAFLVNTYLAKADLSGADLTGAFLSGALFLQADLTDANLSSALIADANFSFANLTGADLSSADVSGADFEAANLSGANLGGAMYLEFAEGAATYDCETIFDGTGFDPVAAGWVLLGPSCSTCGPCPEPGFCAPTLPMGAGISEDHRCEDWSGASLSQANLELADLENVDFSSADLSLAKLGYADAAGAVLVDADLTGASLYETDLQNARLDGADLAGAHLALAKVDGADFSGASLQSATGLSATVGSAVYDCTTSFLGTGFDPAAAGWSFAGTPCSTCGTCPTVGYCSPTLPMGAAAGEDHRCESWVGAALALSVLTDAELDNVDFSGADLSGSTFTGADLTGADVTGADLSGASFGGADLTNVTGLGTTTGFAWYDCGTDFSGTGFDPAAAGWSSIFHPAAQEVRLGSPPNPYAFFAGVSGPYLGVTWNPRIDHFSFVTDATLDLLLVTGAPLNLPLGAPGTLLCDVTAPPLLEVTSPAPGVPFALSHSGQLRPDRRLGLHPGRLPRRPGRPVPHERLGRDHRGILTWVSSPPPLEASRTALFRSGPTSAPRLAEAVRTAATNFEQVSTPPASDERSP